MHTIYIINFLKNKKKNKRGEHDQKILQTFQRRKEKRREYAHEKYRNLSKEEKDKKHQYACKGYRNLSTKLCIFMKVQKKKKKIHLKNLVGLV